MCQVHLVDYDRICECLNELICLYGLDEIGKEEVIIHGQNNEQTEICTKEGSANERLDDGEAGHGPNGETLRESTILSKDSASFFIEWLLYLSCFLVCIISQVFIQNHFYLYLHLVLY